jgi:hypothetical protein
MLEAGGVKSVKIPVAGSMRATTMPVGWAKSEMVEPGGPCVDVQKVAREV